MRPAASIGQRLLWRLLPGCVLISLALASVVAWRAARQTGELLDYQLEQVARVLIDHDFARLAVPVVEDPAMHLDIQVWDAAGLRVYRSGDEVDMPRDTPSGFSRQVSRLGTEPGSRPDVIDEADGDVVLRVFTLRSALRTVQVMQPVSLRRELARDAGLEVLLPTLAALLLLSLWAVVSVRLALRPLRRLQLELGRRHADWLAPIELPDAPQELQQPLATLNGLLARLEAGFAAHRHFIADAAHQLRTPLTAVRLQADNAARATGPAERDAGLRQLIQGLDRLQRLVEQLLALARLDDAGASLRAMQPVALQALAGECLVDLALAASSRSVELVLEAASPGVVRGDPAALRMLLDNLVDNALKHAPPGTRVDVAILPLPTGGTRLQVRDRGPGLPPEQHSRVLERFYRYHGDGQPGSGLGLAIVAEAARRHGAALQLGAAEAGPGLCVRVDFPAGMPE